MVKNRVARLSSLQKRSESPRKIGFSDDSDTNNQSVRLSSPTKFGFRSPKSTKSLKALKSPKSMKYPQSPSRSSFVQESDGSKKYEIIPFVLKHKTVTASEAIPMDVDPASSSLMLEKESSAKSIQRNSPLANDRRTPTDKTLSLLFGTTTIPSPKLSTKAKISYRDAMELPSPHTPSILPSSS